MLIKLEKLSLYPGNKCNQISLSRVLGFEYMNGLHWGNKTCRIRIKLSFLFESSSQKQYPTIHCESVISVKSERTTKQLEIFFSDAIQSTIPEGEENITMMKKLTY